MSPGFPAYVLAAGLAVSASAAVFARPAAWGARCVQPIFLSRASVCGAPPQGDGLAVVAVAFAAGLVVAVSPRAALLACFGVLNLLFAWTSRALLAIAPPLAMGVSRLVAMQDSAIWGPLGLGRLAQLSATATDLEGLALLAAVSLLVGVLRRGSGAVRSSVAGLWAAAACLLILSAEVAGFDSGELSTHVTTLQELVGLAPWFTNADLLASAAVSFAAITGIFVTSKIRP